MVERGRFVVLDGVDGCGKSTQAALLVESLTGDGAPPLHLREPGSTRVGEQLRSIALSREHDLGPAVEALLMTTARRQMLDELVEPALGAGRDVVCERFHPSTFAYQAVAGGLDEQSVLGLLDTWAGSPVPDLIVLLDLDPLEAARRSPEATDRFEDRGVAFQQLVAAGYRSWAERATQPVAVVDASGDEESIAARVLEEVLRVRP
jgi:dTMP kinase